MSDCDRHRAPEGPNEDASACSTCGFPTWVLRPEGEEFGLHADDCSLPQRHERECIGGGSGHHPAPVVRGYWRGMDADIALARQRHPKPTVTPPTTRTDEESQR